MSNGERQFQRKCSICHTLGPDSARRAGPTLHNLFGRRAGAIPGYPYSPTLEKSQLVWSEETVDRLFDIGPDHFVPGSKMPMQRITNPADREDLIAFLRDATRPE
jgi:cytochrome c